MHHQSTLFPSTTEEKRCPVCGKVLVRKSEEPWSHFRKRQTCGVQCMNGLKSYGRLRRGARQAPDPKKCRVCGDVFPRSENEHLATFRKRSTCSTACAKKATGRSHRRAALRDVTAKTCVVCGESFLPRHGESPANFRNKRSTCSQRCRIERTRLMGHARAVTLPQKTCLVCGVLFSRKDGESTTAFTKKATCGVECGNVYRAQSRVKQADRVSPYPAEWTGALRESIRQRDGYRCRLCRRERMSGERAFHIHHINGDKQHCVPSNLVTLCRQCHGIVHRKKEEGLYRQLLHDLVAEIAE